MKIENCYPGLHVWYITKGQNPQFGIIKSINENMPDHVFVVYNCGGQWQNYTDYTAANTNIKDLEFADVKILKVQQSLSSNDSEQQLLVYNESRSIFYQTSITDNLKELFGNKPKSFWYGILQETNIINNNTIAFLNKAPWQKW